MADDRARARLRRRSSRSCRRRCAGVIRFQARARQSEVHGNLKSLFTGLRTQQRKPPSTIRATGFAPERGNRYSYHLENGCSSTEKGHVATCAPMRAAWCTCIGWRTDATSTWVSNS